MTISFHRIDADIGFTVFVPGEHGERKPFRHRITRLQAMQAIHDLSDMLWADLCAEERCHAEST